MMKKILFGLTMVAALASCSDDYTDWADPQRNAQEPAQTVTMTIEQAPAIDYATLTSDQVQIFKPTVAVAATGGAVGMYLSENTTYNVALWNADKTAFETLTTTDGYVSADELKAVVEALYGKRPTAHEIAMNIIGYTDLNGASIANAAAATVTVTLKAPFIDSAYYLTGDMAGWNKEGALEFTHLGSGDVYDNPEFQIVFTTTADNQYWKIIPATNYNGDFWAEGETGVVGTKVDGDTSMEGNLTTSSPQAGKIEKAGIYRMTINMMNYTYKLEAMNFAEYIYTVGNVNGTGWDKSFPMYGPNFDGKYQGYYFLSGEFKFKPNADNWDGDWGQDPNGETGKLVVDGEWNCWTTDGDNNFYQMDVDLAAMTWKLTKVSSISIIGTVNGSWDTDTDLTYNQTDGCWEVTTSLNAGEMKFRMNHDWSVSWGGDVNNLTQINGANIQLAEAGTYKVQLYIAYEGANKLVLTKQ